MPIRGVAARDIANMNDPSKYPGEIVAESSAEKSVVEKYWDDYRGAMRVIFMECRW